MCVCVCMRASVCMNVLEALSSLPPPLHPSSSQVVVHHGPRRGQSHAAALREADIVLTTYSIVEGEYRREVAPEKVKSSCASDMASLTAQMWALFARAGGLPVIIPPPAVELIPHNSSLEFPEVLFAHQSLGLHPISHALQVACRWCGTNSTSSPLTPPPPSPQRLIYVKYFRWISSVQPNGRMFSLSPYSLPCTSQG